MLRRKSISTFLILLAVSLFATSVQAKKKIVLLPFEYKQHKKAGVEIRKFLRTILQNNYEYITKKTIETTIGKELDWKKVDAKQFKDLSNKFMITAYVGGELKKVKYKWTFTVKIYDWKTGEVVFTKDYIIPRWMPNKKDKEAIVMLYLQAIENMKEYEAPKIEVPKPVVKQVVEEEKVDDSINKTPIALKPIEKKKDADWSNLKALRASLKLGFMNRALDFTPASEPYYKTAGLTFAPGWDIEAFPMAFSNPSSGLANIGIGIYGYFMPAFESYPANNEAAKVDTSVYEFGFDLIYRYRVLKSLVLKGRLGYMMKNWTFADKTTLDVPSIAYSTINATLGARFMIGDKANVEGNLSFLLPLGAGDIALGEYYGEASLFGIRLSAVFGYEVVSGLEVIGGFDYTRFDFSFNGYGARTADSASDQYISIFLGARYNM